MNPRVLYRAATYAADARSTADSVISALTPAAWYRNATGVTEAGGFASQWDDYSGNGRHLVQGTGTNQPAYSAGVFTFDGVDNYMKITADAALIQPTTLYFVGKQVTWTNNEYLWDGNTIASCFVRQIDLTPQIEAYAGTGSANSSDLAVNTYGIVCAKFNGASSSLRVNNNAAITGNFGAGNMGGLYLGSTGGAASFSNIAVMEFLIFLAAHDDATQSSVIAALNNALTVF